MASKMFTLQASSAGSIDTVGASEGPAVGGPVGPAEGGPVGPAVGRSEGRVVGGPVMQTVGRAVGWDSGVVVVGGRGSGSGRGPKKRHQMRCPYSCISLCPWISAPQSLSMSTLALTLLTVDAGACLPPTTDMQLPFTHSPFIPATFSQSRGCVL